MAVCEYCNKEMLTADGCDPRPIMIRCRAYEPIRHGMEPGLRGVTRRCHDCAALPGHVHHHGCDMERCPRCDDQAFMCSCPWDGEEADDDLDDDDDDDDEWLEELEERLMRS